MVRPGWTWSARVSLNCTTKCDNTETCFDSRPIISLIADSEFHGSPLIIPSVQPDDLGAYLCIAKNGVPPSMSKRVFLYVQCKKRPLKFVMPFPWLHVKQFYLWFPDPPKIIDHQGVVGVAFGSDVKVDCRVTAYPAPIIFWTFRGKRENIQ